MYMFGTETIKMINKLIRNHLMLIFGPRRKPKLMEPKFKLIHCVMEYIDPTSWISTACEVQTISKPVIKEERMRREASVVYQIGWKVLKKMKAD